MNKEKPSLTLNLNVSFRSPWAESTRANNVTPGRLVFQNDLVKFSRPYLLEFY